MLSPALQEAPCVDEHSGAAYVVVDVSDKNRALNYTYVVCQQLPGRRKVSTLELCLWVRVTRK